MSKQAMTFEEIEDCYPGGASVNEYGEIIVSAQFKCYADSVGVKP